VSSDVSIGVARFSCKEATGSRRKEIGEARVRFAHKLRLTWLNNGRAIFISGAMIFDRLF
jgi:hypothetical protein